ncbi:hypothetical protein BHE74_00019142 [Ensete ventricosum]|nr:hypothetical protein GW17_00051000 [Ensete ventricosum]RWW73011.1 hypothetical protein BHE74_00019142 [Ensete ventricosum]
MNSKDIIHATEPKEGVSSSLPEARHRVQNKEGMKRVAVANLRFLGKEEPQKLGDATDGELQQRRGSPRISRRGGAANGVSPPQDDEQIRK